MAFEIGFQVRLYVDEQYKPNFTDYVTIEFDGFDGEGTPPPGGNTIQTSPHIVDRWSIRRGYYTYFMITTEDGYHVGASDGGTLTRPTRTSQLYRQNAMKMGGWQPDEWLDEDAWDENNPTILEIRISSVPLPEIRVTAPKPTQSGNILKIPNVAGVTYYDILTGLEVSGDHRITQTMIIGVVADQQSSTHEYVVINSEDMWTFMVKKIINVPDPEDHTSHIILPDIDNIEFIDGKDGSILAPGKQLVGSRLEVRVRSLNEEKYSLVHNGPWVYTRTGGITALPAVGGTGTEATIPSHSEIEYYVVHTGQVLPAGIIKIADYAEPSGYLTIAPRAIGDAFLNNPNDRWKMGTFKNGTKIRVEYMKIVGEGPRERATAHASFHQFANVYINGELIKDHEVPLITGEVEIVLERKQVYPPRHPVDWKRGEHGEPIETHLSNGGRFEWISGDRLRYRGTWTEGSYPKNLVIHMTEEYTLDDIPVKVWSSAKLTYPARNPATGAEYTSELSIPRDQLPAFFDITMDGKELDWRRPLTDTYTDEQKANIGESEITTGYHEFKVSIKNPDFMWFEDEWNRKVSYISHPGAKFTINSEGDLVWNGTVDTLREGFHMRFNIRTFTPTGVQEINNFDGRYNLTLDREKNAVLIPEWPIVQYFDVHNSKIIPPGWLDITRYTVIGLFVEPVLRKIDGEYVLYRLMFGQGETTSWSFGVEGVEFEVTAEKPTQNGYLLFIPDDVNVVYYDVIEGALVSGVIDLRYRDYMKSLIRPFARYENHRLTNEGIEWEFYNSNLVYPVKPTRVGNVITIPEVLGVYYRVQDTDGVDKIVPPGDFHRITSDTQVFAFAEDEFEIGETSDVEWSYEFEEEERRQVAPIPPTVDGNWVQIPVTDGVIYINKETGERVSGNLYITKNTTILAIPEDEDKIELIGETTQWFIAYAGTSDKEITIPVLDPRIVVQVNGEVISGNSFSVPVREYVSIILTITSGARFQDIPFLSNNLGYERNFFLSEDGTRASLSAEFLNNDAVNLHIGVVDIPTKTLTFKGENTYLTFAKPDGKAVTLRPGDRAEIELNKSYRFSIRPNLGYELDVIPSMTHGTYTTRSTDANRTYAAFDLLHVQHNVEISAFAYPVIITDPDPVDPEPGDPDDPVDPEIPVGVTGFNNIYMVNKRTLSEISREMLVRKRQFMISGGQGGLNHDSQLITDPHTYIINTIQLPFKVSQEAVLDRQRITLGYTSLAPSAQRLKSDKLKVSLGNIYVTPKYNNAYDYKNTDIILHLPYSGPVHLDPNYVLDEELSIEYLVDAYTGHTTINIRSSFVNNNVFHSKETYIGNEIPFISMKDGSVVGSTSESRSLVNNNVMTPYVEVIRNIPYEMDSDFNKDTTLTVDNLHDVTGRIYVHNISLNVNTTLTEENTIKSILAGGITIK